MASRYRDMAACGSKKVLGRPTQVPLRVAFGRDCGEWVTAYLKGARLKKDTRRRYPSAAYRVELLPGKS